jgi:hypothetical protein
MATKYIGYPESKFRWAIGKKEKKKKRRRRRRIYFQTIYIAI